eukprot:SAG31_NODE_490_length_14932_cov_9.350300_5_plen_70_part_00
MEISDISCNNSGPRLLAPRRNSAGDIVGRSINVDTFSISALHLAIKVPYFSNSGHKNEKVTSYLASAKD